MKDSETTRLRLYRQGLNDREVGEALGLSRTTIRDWRVARNLRANKFLPEQETEQRREIRIREGDRITFTPSAFAPHDVILRDGTRLPGTVKGRVTWIHPRRRFYLAEADVDGVPIRECFIITERRTT